MAESIREIVGASSKMGRYLKPLKEGEVAEFRLIISGHKDLSREGHPPIKPGPKLFSKKEYINDPDQGRKILIQYVDAWQNEVDPKTKVQYESPILGRPIFVDGSLTITANEPEKYYFLMLSNKNATNPFRDPSVKAQFYRHDTKVISRDKMAKTEEMTVALLWVKMSDFNELRSINEKLSINHKYNGNYDDLFALKHHLSDVAMKNPMEITKNSNDHMTKRKIAVKDALHFMIVSFDEQERVFYSNISGKSEAICSVDVGEDRFQKIVEHFSTKEGRTHWMHISKELKKLAGKEELALY